MNTRFTGTSPRGESFIHLVGDLQSDLKMLIKKEIELAKTEMGEKFKDAGRNAALVAIGGVMGLFAAFMLLLGAGAIMAQWLKGTGMSAGTAYFISYAGLSLVLAGAGFLLVRKAMDGLAKFSLSPEKALETVRGPEPVEIEIRHETKEPKPNSNDLREEVIATRARMDSEMNELKERLTPMYLLRSSFSGVKHHPLRALMAGASAGLGGYIMWRNRHAAAAKRLKAQRKWWQFKHA